MKTIDEQIEWQCRRVLLHQPQNRSPGVLSRTPGSDAAIARERLMAEAILAALERVRELEKLRPLSQWSDDDGDVLWWKLPINEPPYVGSPLSSDWPGQHTHWTRIMVPREEV